jgi:hypothetical protein
MEKYLVIQENVVTNICLWDGNTSTWTPPSGAIMLFAETAPTRIWALDNKEYILINSSGDANIGFTYDGTSCITNEEKPIYVEPSNGILNTTVLK